MNCEQFTQQMLKDPYCKDQAFLEHKAACRGCRESWQEALVFEERLKNAMRIDVSGESGVAPVMSVRQRTAARLAATTVVSLILGFTGIHAAQYLFAEDKLPQLVLHHVEREAEDLKAGGPLPATMVAERLHDRGFMLTGTGIQPYSLESCWIRKGRGVHMVLAGLQGPIDVLLMPGEEAKKPHPVVSRRYQGILLPTAYGSMAVVGRPGETLDSVARALEQGLHRDQTRFVWF